LTDPTANSKTGIFGIFPKEARKFVTFKGFKTGILGGPAIKVTAKVGLKKPTHPVNIKATTIEFCAI